MGDSQGNPFISNPFVQGATQKKSSSEPPTAAPAPAPAQQRRRKAKLSLETPEEFSQLTTPSHSSASKSTTPKAVKPLSKSVKSATKTARKTQSKSNKKGLSQSTPSRPPLTSGHTSNGYKVQVLAKIPMPTNTNAPSRDYLWFAVYPIIPRVGDCIFRDGRYFRVDAVFLYENTNASWCADLEVSYYTRRH